MRIRKTGAEALQSKLKELSFFNGTLNAKIDSKTEKACLDYLADVEAKGKMPSSTQGWKSWNRDRQVVACFQLVIEADGIEAGPIDGYYGSLTRTGADIFIQRYQGIQVVDFSAIEVKKTNPHNFPVEGSSDFYARYGKVRIIPGPKPNCSPVSSRLTNVACPWKLRFTWELSSHRNYFRVHEEVAESLESVIAKIWDHYGMDGVKEFKLDYFGGDNNCRYKRGTTTKTLKNVSTHAYGIAIDFNDPENGLHTSTLSSKPPSLAHPDLISFWEFWEEEGWYSLGRHENRDWMHVQAAWR